MTSEIAASCPICDGEVYGLEDYLVLNKYKASLVQCSRCNWVGFLHPCWLHEAYSNAIAATDTGAVQRTLNISSRLASLLVDFGFHRSSCLDYGGGSGLLVRMMRDKGFDFYWDDGYCPNIYAQGFEAARAPAVDVITLFEVLEHLESPLQVLTSLASKHSPKLIVFTTELYRSPKPPSDWWYLALETGQHISFFAEETMRWIAANLKSSYFVYMGLHCLAFGVEVSPRIVRHDFLSRIRRKLMRRKVNSQLQSKTLSDRELLLAGRSQ